MSSPQVEVDLANSQITIDAREVPQILNGSHRIFFSNILGFDIIEKLQRYIIKNVNTHKILVETVKYLNDRKIGFILNEEAKALLENIEDSSIRLKRSKERGKLLKKRKVKRIEVPGLKRKLKPYQIPAVAHIVNVDNAANFSVPGSGKTSIVLSAYAILKSKEDIKKIMVIGPRSSFMPWEEEFYSCFNEKPSVTRIVGSKLTRKKLYEKINSSELILLTYQMACNDAAEIIKILQNGKVLLVLDESHNIKRLEGGTWSESILAIAPYAKKRIILSGTPTPNSPLDLWSQMTFLWPDTPPLGPRDRFRYRVEKNEEESIKEISDDLYPLYWRIRKSDLGLPKPRFHRIKVAMSPYQRKIYDALAAKVLSEIVDVPEERSRLRIWRKGKMVRLLQAASNPTLLTQYSEEFKIPPLDGSGLSVDQLIEKYPQYEEPAKIKAVVKLIRELVKNNKKVLIWTSFVHNIKTLQKSIHDLSPSIIYGDVPKDGNEDEEFNREKIIHQFKNSPKSMVLIANPSACAESISLHKICYHAIYLDRTFNGAHYMQSLDRIHRVGLDKKDKVNYWIFESKNTIDEVISVRLEEKKKKMLKLLEEEFAVLDLDSPEDEFSEESEEDKDFALFIKHLKSITKPEN